MPRLHTNLDNVQHIDQPTEFITGGRLFHCVLECLVIPLPRVPSKEEQRMLTVLARTCRAFSEPSLELLWQRLNSLTVLGTW